MIQLIKEGPQIPKELEQALRYDSLVFFCGAGISVSKGLPLFNKLVKKVCDNLKVNIDDKPLLKSAKKRKDYASILDLLEENQDFSVKPEILRKEIINILNPHNGKSDIHEALLDLSALPDNRGRRLGKKQRLQDTEPRHKPL